MTRESRFEDARFEDGAERPLRLRAETPDDLAVVSALLQDSVAQTSEITWAPRHHRFSLLLNRFRWEDVPAAERQGRSFERVRAVLAIDGVLAARSLGIAPADRDLVLELLALAFDAGADGAGTLRLIFAGDGEIALDVECLDLRLVDVTRPYLARSLPNHPAGLRTVFAGFSDARIEVGDGVAIRARVAGDGPPVLLLHGYPQTHACWHRVAPRLVAAGFSVVLADLRGYGDSSKPASSPDHATYAKRAMAADQVAVMRALGHQRFSVAGHDRGGRVAHRMALDHPDAVARLAVLDIAPTATMYARTDRAFATGYYHWFFLIQPAPLPERLIGADPAFYLRSKLDALTRSGDVFAPEAFAEYLRAFADPATIAATCEDYRAAATIDLEHDAADDSRRIEMPLLALWGRGLVGRSYDVLATWREKATDVRGHALQTGHYLPEEAPEAVAEALAGFFGEA